MSTLNRTTRDQLLWQKIESHLEQEKRRVFDEILQYPPPIPACDVQFNFLLAERAAITQEIRRMNEIWRKKTETLDYTQATREFIESCKYVDGLLRASLLSQLEQVSDE